MLRRLEQDDDLPSIHLVEEDPEYLSITLPLHSVNSGMSKKINK